MKRVIWLTGMPRSGTTWISQILGSSLDVRLKFCPLFSYSFKNALDSTSTGKQWQELFSKVYVTKDPFMDQQHLKQGGLVPDLIEKEDPHILLIKSNRFHNLTESILQKCPNVMFVGIIRHPCATIHSWLTNPLEFPACEDPKLQWRHGICRKTGPGEFWGFDDWKQVTALYLRLAQKWPERFLVHRYEEFLRSSLRSSQELFEQLGLKMTQLTKSIITATQGRHDGHRRSVYKDPSKLDNWRTSMDQSISAEIYTELEQTKFAIFLED